MSEPTRLDHAMSALRALFSKPEVQGRRCEPGR
jgi:hypothetical protein